MHEHKDLELVEPLIRLKNVLAGLDDLALADPVRARRIGSALCQLQHAIDLLEQAQTRRH